MTNLTLTPEEIIKQSFTIMTGVKNGKEWKMVIIKGNHPDPKKRKGFNHAFSHNLIKLLEEHGAEEFALGSTTK